MASARIALAKDEPYRLTLMDTRGRTLFRAEGRGADLAGRLEKKPGRACGPAMPTSSASKPRACRRPGPDSGPRPALRKRSGPKATRKPMSDAGKLRSQ